MPRAGPVQAASPRLFDRLLPSVRARSHVQSPAWTTGNTGRSSCARLPDARNACVYAPDPNTLAGAPARACRRRPRGPLRGTVLPPELPPNSVARGDTGWDVASQRCPKTAETGTPKDTLICAGTGGCGFQDRCLQPLGHPSSPSRRISPAPHKIAPRHALAPPDGAVAPANGWRASITRPRAGRRRAGRPQAGASGRPSRRPAP